MTVQASHRRNARSLAAIIISVSALTLALASSVSATDKVTICHATSAGEVNPYNAIVVGNSAADWAPHLDDNGSPTAGHEQDFLLPFEGDDEDCEEGAPEPTPTPTPEEPTPTPTPEGSQAGGTGTPAASIPSSAMSAGGIGGPIATLVFGAVLLASLGGLAYANVKSARSRG